MRIGNVEIKNNIALAPMAGVTDLPFRLLCKEMGCNMLYTEMVSAKAILYKNKNTNILLNIDKAEHPIAVQLFGSDPDIMAEIGAKVAEGPCDFIDINMGCPTKKVIKNNCGAGLLTDINKMISILKSVKNVSPLPVSVKIRLGFKRGEGGEIERALALKENGACFLTLHGRYASDLYRGYADWEKIAQVKKALGEDYILIGNGDIKTKEDAKKVFENYQVDGIMIGRAAIGNPWIFSELNKIFDKEENIDKNLKSVIKEHINGCCEFYGEISGIHFMRKFIMKYLNGFKMENKIKLMKCESKEKLFELLDELII